MVLTEIVTSWKDPQILKGEVLDEVTFALSDWIHEQTSGDHDAAIESMLRMACVIAMAGYIHPEDLRDRFSHILAGYTTSVATEVTMTPGGEA
jgi:hypothetical protein